MIIKVIKFLCFIIKKINVKRDKSKKHSIRRLNNLKHN